MPRRMKDKGEEKSPDLEKDSGEGYQLSKEAIIGPEQEKYVKRLGENRMVVASEPRFGPDEEGPDEGERGEGRREGESTGMDSPEPPEERSTEGEESETSLGSQPPNSEGAGRGAGSTRGVSELNKATLISVLASYGVPLDAPVRKLIREIERRGDSHLRRELRKRPS